MMERAEAVRRLRMISDGIDPDEFPQNRNVRNHAAKTQTALSLAIEALSSPATDKSTEIVAMIDALRSEEGDIVTIISDNVGFNGLPDRMVLCWGEWTGWQDRRFPGDTLAEALAAAIRARHPKGE